MVLGKLPVPGRPTIRIRVGQGPTALALGAGGGCLDIFTLDYPFCPLSPSLWETARYRLKYCLKGPFNPKQPTNQPTETRKFILRFQKIEISLDFEYRELSIKLQECRDSIANVVSVGLPEFCMFLFY